MLEFKKIGDLKRKAGDNEGALGYMRKGYV